MRNEEKGYEQEQQIWIATANPKNLKKANQHSDLLAEKQPPMMVLAVLEGVQHE